RDKKLAQFAMLVIGALLLSSCQPTLHLDSMPSEASVFSADGSELGQTPLVLEVEHGHSLELRLEKDGYTSAEAKIQIPDSGQSFRETVKFPPIPLNLFTFNCNNDEFYRDKLVSVTGYIYHTSLLSCVVSCAMEMHSTPTGNISELSINMSPGTGPKQMDIDKLPDNFSLGDIVYYDSDGKARRYTDRVQVTGFLLRSQVFGKTDEFLCTIGNPFSITKL
ncbi:MAG: PEGA domain-containing protein, partial [Leptospiraceae bacterium]|nr:PEGA domain-containing protein [Leptospiraceae bacterium]